MDTLSLRRRHAAAATPAAHASSHSPSSNSNTVIEPSSASAWLRTTAFFLLLFGIVAFVTTTIIISQYKNVSTTTQHYHGEERTWHGGHPVETKPGSCWCSGGGNSEYCMCTPSVAVDIVLYQKVTQQRQRRKTTGDGGEEYYYHDYKVWVVRRSDTNQLATIGGFVDVGETVERAVVREVEEETGIIIPQHLLSTHRYHHSHYSSNININNNFNNNNNSVATATAIQLIGVYSDPRRDNRRHIVSIAYALEFIPTIMTTKDGSGIPKAGDDAKDVIAIPLHEIGNNKKNDNNNSNSDNNSGVIDADWYADHLSILLDFKKQIMKKDNDYKKDNNVDKSGDTVESAVIVEEEDRSGELFGGDTIARSTCS